MKTGYLLFVALIISCNVSAQSYKWVTGGGSTTIMFESRYDERVTNMCTDANHNLYLTAFVGDNSIKADTFYKAIAYNPDAGMNPHFLLASYQCNGTMRWAKLFDAHYYAQSDGIAYDGKGNIYCAGVLDGNNKHIGYDTVISSYYLTQFVAKFDTSGTFKWIRFIGPDNSTTWNGTEDESQGSRLAIDDSGYIHFYPFIKSGVQITLSVLSTTGTYDIKYDSTGNLISATKMPMDSTDVMLKIVIDKRTGNAYAGVGNTTGPVGGIRAYSPTDVQLWSDTMQHGVFNDITFDGNQYIYGTAYGNPLILGHDTLVSGYRGEIFRVDTNGHPEEITEFKGGSSTLHGITLLPHGKIACVGTIEGYVQYGTDSIPGAGQHSFALIVDTNKNLYLLDQLPSNGYYDWASAITSDNEGNVYLGGQVEDTIGAGDLPGYHSNGGNTDFYVVKYGYKCDCDLSTEPTPMFTASGDSMHVPDAVTFMYTGSNTPDSVRWDFGDSTTSTTLNPTHSYTDTGVIKVCLTVYGCDSGMYCTYIKTLPPLGVSNLAAFPNIQVYPNPMSNALFITGVPIGTQVKLYNVIGQQVYEGTTKDNRHIIHTEDLTVGTYILQLTNKDGERMNMTVIKQ